MKKYLASCLILCFPLSAAAKIGAGFYASAGVGGGWLDASQVTDFTLEYPFTYATEPDPDQLNTDIVDAFNDTAQYGSTSDSVIAGRAALGYLWSIFEGEPTKFANSIYTVNATLGLEFGYRLFDKVQAAHTETEVDDINVPPCSSPVPTNCPDQPFPYDVSETATTKTNNHAFDLLAVARFPFTQDNKLALLLKGGVAYNMYSIETTTLTINADLEVPQEGYDRVIELSSTQNHDEFLPVLGAGLEYMYWTHVGVSVEYSALMGSSHNADTQLLTGNIIFRM